jgi:PPK2 family polyphosphate:nucleotide phosphotransferase
MAEQERAVLVVLQGLDGSGKSGTVKHVAAALNPVGIRVASFKAPEGKETDEPFLDRIRRELPGPGQIGFFDRSYIEDAIVPLALGEITDVELDERLDEINSFESELKKRDVVLVKCFLHLSYDEQRERFLRRLQRPDKHWKFSESDLDTRQLWPKFQMAYGTVIGRTNSSLAPWFAVPADHKWYRNWAVASLLAEHLAAMAPEFPAFTIDADAVRQRLEPPN